jgi:hypothetical protein
MISKITHIIKYGIIGGLAGAIIKTLANIENPVFPMTSVLIWTAAGVIIGILYSFVIEKWFNETYHD